MSRVRTKCDLYRPWGAPLPAGTLCTVGRRYTAKTVDGEREFVALLGDDGRVVHPWARAEMVEDAL